MDERETEVYRELLARIREAEETRASSLDLGVYSAASLANVPAELGRLTSLRSLSLRGWAGLSYLAPLASLKSLQSLDVSGCGQIRDLQPLAGLSSLQSLDVSWCGQISDLRPLAGLSALQSLDVSRCRQISDLQPLAGLSALQSLDVSACGQISDLRPLAGLSSLQSLNVSWCGQISDLRPLASLSALQSLDVCGCEQLSDLRPLAGLSSLKSLDVSRCEQIGDLQALAGLTSLQSLRVSHGKAGLEFFPLKNLLPTLTRLVLYGCQWVDLPLAICGDGEFQDVLAKVRAHYSDLAAGAVPDAEIKVLFLGNGGVGKSQLSRRLRGLPYDPALPTTHGIETSKKTLEIEGATSPIALNLWDFGGQEIYHGSHSLFLGAQSIFLILWTPEREQKTADLEQSIPMRHRPLAYWLDYVRWCAGSQVLALVIQSQCDTAADRLPRLPGAPALEDFSSLRIAQVSASTGLGLDLINASLKEAVRDSIELRPPSPIGLGRVRVRDRLRELLTADQARPPGERSHRWLERVDFDRLCDEAGGISDTEALLDFLHHSGAVFYRRDLFSGHIVLDQNWALEAIYTLFDRKRIFPLLRGYGRFSRADLEALVWSSYTRQEQLVFLGMMESCGICFKARELSSEDCEYIAPELLPEWSKAQDTLLVGRLLKETPALEVEARYGFLHEGVVRNFLSRIGRQAGDAAVYWRYGCWFYEKTTDCRVVIIAFGKIPRRKQAPVLFGFAPGVAGLAT